MNNFVFKQLILIHFNNNNNNKTQIFELLNNDIKDL